EESVPLARGDGETSLLAEERDPREGARVVQTGGAPASKDQTSSEETKRLGERHPLLGAPERAREDELLVTAGDFDPELPRRPVVPGKRVERGDVGAAHGTEAATARAHTRNQDVGERRDELKAGGPSTVATRRVPAVGACASSLEKAENLCIYLVRQP